MVLAQTSSDHQNLNEVSNQAKRILQAVNQSAYELHHNFGMI